ncbi:phage minor capsid protein [Bacillus altitudinis]|uniref:phage minor capsid protein n=1 Tax=Bacillus altitudinis TaxID=293387 RepID=UPI0021012937|nr:phage minor capsid protein [Bacillus altitudinis]UTV34869.1 phage minor capsid protein [Bacillus altitudinis]
MNELYKEVPETYEADNDEFDALYVVAWALIIKAIMRLVRLPPTASTGQLLQMERQVNSEVKAIITQLNKDALKMATSKVTEAYIEGVAYSRAAMSQENKLVHIRKNQLNDSHTQRLNKMIDQTQDDLLKATHNTNENLKKVVRQVVSKEISGAGFGKKIGKVSNMSKRVEDQLRKQFIEAGIKDADVAIIDRAKRRWKLRTYSAMAVRTKMNMAYIDAIREEAMQDGHDLAIISTKPDTYDQCKHYEGMIISLNGLTAGYLSYEEIRKSKECFHPNCGHFVRPVGGLSMIPKNIQDNHAKLMRHYTQNHK